jgi:hypothetical protein
MCSIAAALAVTTDATAHRLNRVTPLCDAKHRLERVGAGVDFPGLVGNGRLAVVRDVSQFPGPIGKCRLAVPITVGDVDQAVSRWRSSSFAPPLEVFPPGWIFGWILALVMNGRI